MFGRFFGASWDAIMGFVSEARWALINVISATFLGVIVILLCRPSVEASFVFILFPWIFSAWRLFSLRRLLSVHLTGEAADFFAFEFFSKKTVAKPPTTGATTATATTGAGTGAQAPTITETGPLKNSTSDAYLKMVLNVFLGQTVLFICLVLYVNFTQGGIGAAVGLLMVLVIVAIWDKELFLKVFSATVKIMATVCVVWFLFALFPSAFQVAEFYFTRVTGGGVHVVESSTAKLVNENAEIKRKQKEARNNKVIDSINRWQVANPGVPLPQDYQNFLDRVARGE